MSIDFPLHPTRRQFLQNSFAVALAGIPAIAAAQAQGRKPRIVLRSSWQTVNIGDIAHTPGVLALLEKHLPDAEVRLWPSSVADGVEAMLKARFPNVVIMERSQEAIKAAFEECDFLLHGSGPSLVAYRDVARWRAETGKPYGIYGITTGTVSDEPQNVLHNPGKQFTLRELFNDAQFTFFRDTVSLQKVKDAGITCPIMEFGPDGAFAVDLRNDAAAETFLKTNALEPGKFLCVIPRLRNTPYWLIKKGTVFNQEKHDRNEAMKEHDHAQLRAAIIAVTRETDLKILICPEDQTQMAIGKEMLYQPLPDDVKKKVVLRENYWLTDEALSTYVRSAGLFGNEMHSPIMCIGNGIPAIVCRWEEQTSKGFMWRDIGLGDWLFTLDNEDELPGIAPAVLAMAKDPEGSKAKALKAREVVLDRQQKTMAILKQKLPATA
ncbi:polysaccharide pyruvyl transferase family protein [Phragmitibacter flavus]|uniref:Polysaccharide pyruvyl transferase family protein n=1 Tax=Phragmitibacter flavus TaxID=2576071 RepID=A0A5R8KFY9_9BACT|nr:polysaccharide pyruvyl transferase family protein [Phragmitibacter flavus]TLD71218.1 polysaccharide pyruvyl transferase family protein [Phragmitibacter flavus]